MVKTYLIDKSVAVLLHIQKLNWEVPILLHTKQNGSKVLSVAVHLSNVQILDFAAAELFIGGVGKTEQNAFLERLFWQCSATFHTE